MLQNTFCHLPGVGPKTEQRLWKAGIHTWNDFQHNGPSRLQYPSGRYWSQLVDESLRHLAEGNAQYFEEKIPAKEKWRMFRDFRSSCAYLDIETTGLGSFGDHITTIALYTGSDLRCYVYGINLEEFAEDVKKYKLLVTFNGTTFDLPFIRRELKIPLQQAHIDMRFLLRSLGYSGGLKRCETALGLDRGGLKDIDGSAAVLLWREYQRTENQRALETLLAYNVQDTVNLQTLLMMAFNRKVQCTPFAGEYLIPEIPDVVNPYKPEPVIVEKVLRMMSWRIPS